MWFLYFQDVLSASDAVMMYVIFDVSATALEVPLGVLSDRIGRRITLILSALSGALAALLFALGSSFEVFALGNLLLGAWTALASGTDSAFLYESLEADGRKDEIERHELIAWRFNFAALAISAAAGGLMAYQFNALPYWGVVVALLACALVAFQFREVGSQWSGSDRVPALEALREAFQKPVLIWLFVLSLLMYAFSHVPFVFGQPFILEALSDVELDGEAPIISGLVTAIMMILSVLVSLVAPRVRHAIGLPVMLLLAFSIQIALIVVLALTNSALAIAFLFLRMVPDSLSRPFIVARIQPELRDETRATYLSLQSFCGRLLFAATLYAASVSTNDVGAMPYSEIRVVLGWYAGLGLVCFGALAFGARRVRLEGDKVT